MKTNLRLWKFCLPLAAIAFASCSDDDPTPDPVPPVDETEAKYFIAAENDNGTYNIAVDDLTTGTTTTIGNGIEDPVSYSHYAYNGTEAVMAFSYRQGDPTVGRIWGLDETGALSEIGAGFQLTHGFSSMGPFENYLILARGNRTFADETVGANFYFMDLEADGAVEAKQLTTLGLAGEGLESQPVGVADHGDGTFYSALDVTDGNVDEVQIVQLDRDLNVQRVISDDRIGSGYGRFRSARYSLIVNDDEGNTYVFGNPLDGETKGGALKINKGSNDFDGSYYFNIEDKAEGHSFRKVRHVTGKYFLLEFYNDIEATTNSPAYKYGIVNVETQSFAWVTGLPAIDTIASTPGWPFSADEKVFIPIVTTDANPFVYVIDPVTAVATKGIEIQGATDVGGLAKLTY